jgi:hypothetical protein
MKRRLAAAAAAAAPLLALALAVPASASTGPGVPSIEESGYQAADAQFRFVHATVFLRDPTQYSASLAGYGLSVQLWSAGRVIVLGVSDGTGSPGPYSPAVAVFDRVTHALVCSTAEPPGPLQCPGTPVSWANGSVSFPAGRSVTESLFYDQRSGIVTATVLDVTTGLASSATYHAGIGQSFKAARIGAEVGNTPWDDAGYINPPAVVTKLAAFSGAELTTYSGSNSNLRSWWVHSKLIMTSDGTSAGDTRATSTDLSGGGSSFTVNLQP